MLVRAELRRRWGSLLVVALVVAITGGVTLAALAGARRTASSFERFKTTSRNHDVLLFAEGITRAEVGRLRRLPGVAGVGYARQLAMTRPDGDFLAVGGAMDDSVFRDVDRPKIVDGRMPRPSHPEEVILPEPLARATHLRVGDTIPVQGYLPRQIGSFRNDATDLPPPEGPEVTLRAVGIGRLPIDLSLQGQAGGVLLLQRSFTERYGPRIGNFSGETGAVLLVRLRDGDAGVDRFLESLRDVLNQRNYDVDPAALTIGGIQDSIDLLAIGILVFGALAGIAGLVALALIIGRQVSLLAAGQVAVRDLGLSRRRRLLAVVTPMLAALAVGAVVALVAAWLASPLFPFGVAGRAEPHPGLAFDAPSLLGGTVLLLLVLGGIATASAWRATRPDASVERVRKRPSMVARVLENAGLRPPATIGVGMALERGRGRTAVPVRSALVGVAVAVVGVVAVAVFATSLDHLATTPRAYGVSWDGVVDDTKMELADQNQLCGDVKTRWTDSPTVEAVASVCSLGITLDGRAVGALGITSLRGHIGPTVLEGREPVSEDEVAVGSETLRALDAKVGDRVTGKSPVGNAQYTIVGRVVVPSVVDPQAVADGAIMTGPGLARLENADNLSSNIAPVVRFRAGVDRAKAERELDALPGIGRPDHGFVPVATPLEVRRVEQLDRLPFALAIFLTVLGAIAVGHLLVTSVQRRRRDFAVLKSLGFGRAQTYRTVCVQATTVALVGIVIGLVVGAALGAFVWRAAAGRVGVLGEVEVPGLLLVGIAMVTVVLANLIAAVPARTAARTPVAVTLRAD